MATTKIINDLIDLNQTGNTTALKGCVGTNAQQPTVPTISVQYLVVGGGGAANGSGSGGGGAGGLSTGTIAVPNNTAVNIVVGQGAAASGTWDGTIYNGEDSGFYTIQGQGGGSATERADGNPGGSGGGGGHLPNSGTIYNGGSGVANQGNNGGDATSADNWNTGGGGGTGSVGADGTASQSGNGGSGKDAVGSPISIITQANGITANVGEVNGAELNFAGGGGGGGNDTNNILPGNGGSGGGGNGSDTTSVNGFNGTLNTGGGGGGGNGDSATPGGAGGSGVVILKYANADVSSITIGGSLAGGITTGTTADCNYPTTSNGLALYQFSSDATDTCGNYDGTNDSGITYGSPGVFGNGAQFGGGSERIDINQAILGSGTTKIWSTSFWFLTSSTAEQYLNNSAAAGAFTGFGLFINPSGYLRYQTSNGSGSFSPYLSLEDRSVQDGNWHHVVATYSSAGGTNDAYMYLYLDGQNVTDLCTARNSWTQGGGATWSSFTIPRISLGNWADSSTYPSGLYPLIGSMDQVRFFDVALTADQVAMLYVENIGATKFTESSDTVLVFKAGSGTINLTGSSVLGPKVGDLRTNTDQTSASSASAMEHYMSTGWRVLTNT